MKPGLSICKFAVMLAVSLGLAQMAFAQPARTRTVTAQMRTITVSTRPFAIIWIDGVRYGSAGKTGSREIKTIAPGAHTLRVRLDGYKERNLPITALQKGVIDVALTETTDPAELAFQEGEALTGSDREKSAEAYHKAVKLKPAYADAWLGLARVQLDAGNLDESAAAIASARRVRPGFAEATAVEGRVYKESGEEAKAIAAFKRSIIEGKGFQPEAYAGLGLLYKEKAEGFGGAGDFENETASYNEAAKSLRLSLKQLSGAPDAVVIYQLLGLVLERQKKVDEAIALYEEFLLIFPDTAEATAVRSFIVQLKKDKGIQE